VAQSFRAPVLHGLSFRTSRRGNLGSSGADGSFEGEDEKQIVLHTAPICNAMGVYLLFEFAAPKTRLRRLAGG
jgi:hypothetical protein